AACRRVEAAVQSLVAPGDRADSPAAALAGAPHHPGAERALAHLHDLEAALAALAAPLRGTSRAPYAKA
ncbi:hypothetical protein ADK38_22445, partial [Streptomyces varsoviensis]